VPSVKPSSVSAVIVSYFTGPLLARAIASLKAQPEVSEIVVVDNGNWDGAVSKAAAATPEGAPVQVIQGQGNVGFAKACNMGAAAATGEALLFLNPDAVMPAGGVEQLLKDVETLDRPWLVGAKLIDPEGPEQQGSRRATLTPWRAFVEATKLYKFAPRHPYFRRFNLHADLCPPTLSKVPTISGACFFVSREDYFSINGMDEQYFLHVEDVDFCLRFGKAGGDVYFDPNVSVTHFKSSSRVNPMRVEHRKTVSMLRYFRTHFNKEYPQPFHWLVWAALWFSFYAKYINRMAARSMALISFGAAGGARFRRARGITGRHLSR